MERKKCIIPNCDKYGRMIGQLGNIELVYCMKHEDYGIRALNFLINSKFRYKFVKFLDEVRQDLFIKNEPELCTDCNKKISKYVSKMIVKVEELEK